MPGSKASLLIPGKMVFPRHQAAFQKNYFSLNFEFLVNQFEEKPDFYSIYQNILYTKLPLYSN